MAQEFHQRHNLLGLTYTHSSQDCRFMHICGLRYKALALEHCAALKKKSETTWLGLVLQLILVLTCHCVFKSTILCA